MKNTKRRDFLKTAGIAAIGVGCLSVGAVDLHAKEKSHQVLKDKEFQPGERVEFTGIYDVIHDKIDGEHHAHNHQVIATAGRVFPRCKACHEWVRFQLAEEAQDLDNNPQFESR